MTVRAGINGFGRIGRMTFRAALGHKDIEIVAVNDLIEPATLAHLLKYDSVHGRLDADVSTSGTSLYVNGKEVKIYQEKDPSKLPWKENSVETVFECTGLFRERSKAAGHLEGGAKKVIISAPAKEPDLTVVMGVNHQDYNPRQHHVVSNASCTTNCLAPVCKVLMDSFGLEKGLMTTTHAYTADQRLLDAPHKDLRRARAAGLSMIPTTTGAAQAVGLVIPQLEGKMSGMAIRVPTANVSIIDLVVQLSRPATRDEVNQALKEEAENSLKGILDYSGEPLVSVDLNGSPFSSIVDGISTMAFGDMVKVLSWYDNEFGYSSRLVDLALYMAKSEA